MLLFKDCRFWAKSKPRVILIFKKRFFAKENLGIFVILPSNFSHTEVDETKVNVNSSTATQISAKSAILTADLVAEIPSHPTLYQTFFP